MSALVYQAINAVAADLSERGIAKSHTNQEGDYQYRSIDDVMAALAPLLARHKLCVLPRILERTDRQSGGSIHVTVRAAFDVVSAMDGTRHVIESFGEAIDESDRATAKAISGAYKSAMLQTFCIPVPQEEAEDKRPSFRTTIAVPEPPQGWESWVQDTIDVLQSCETAAAIQRLCEARRRDLSALQRAQPGLYTRVGDLIAARLVEFQEPKKAPAKQRTRRNPTQDKPKLREQLHATEAA